MINFDALKIEHKKLSERLSEPDIYNNREQYQKIARRFSFLEKVIERIQERDRLIEERAHLNIVISSPEEEEEMKSLAREELPAIEAKIGNIEETIGDMLLEDSSEADRDVIIEIRAAAGGDEATLFAADLFKMYSRYIEKKGWKLEVLSSHATEVRGFKEIVFSVKGKGCYSWLKFESGVHRVQRVPVTESGGRIHTSTATVAVLIEPKNVEIEIDPQELKIDTFRASGAGGQHVNRTDSAVRITHFPTGLVITCQDERSQIKNKAKALRVLKARILDQRRHEEESKVSQARKFQVGTGERSEKIRTYNFPERRVTEHRINLTLYRLESILEGDLDEIVKNLIKEERKKKYEAQGLAQ